VDFGGKRISSFAQNKPKKDRRYRYDGDDDVGKNQPDSKEATAAPGTSTRRMAHPLTTLRAKLLF
jgi:hypothetical protein